MTKFSFAQDTIYWSKNKKLSIEDFKENSPKQSEFKAVSNVGIDYKVLSNDLDYILSVNAVFFCKDSWFEDKTSTHLLNHEQRHFDIMEIYARLSRKSLSNRTYTIDSIIQEYNRITDMIDIQCNLVQEIYDEETNLSRNIECQAEWDKYIDQMLKELEAYSNPIVKLKIKEEEE